MNSQAISFSIYESSLLLKGSISIPTLFKIMQEVHVNEPDVVALFSDLEKDWNNQLPNEKYPVKGVAPFMERSELDPIFFVAALFAEIGSVTTTLDRAYEDMALAFLLQRKVRSTEPSPEDRVMGGYLLQTCALDTSEKGARAQKIILSWSNDPSWTTIVEKKDSTEVAVADWRGTWKLALGMNPTLLPAELFLRKSLYEGGTADQLGTILLHWDMYTSEYRGLDSLQ